MQPLHWSIDLFVFAQTTKSKKMASYGANIGPALDTAVDKLKR